jgi:hypothetical protein
MKRPDRSLFLVGLGSVAALVALESGARAQQGEMQKNAEGRSGQVTRPADPPDPGEATKRSEPSAPQEAAGDRETTQPMGQMTAELTSVPATVEEVDRRNRKLTLKDPGANRFTVQVPASVVGLEDLEKGDRIDLSYYQETAVALPPPGSPAAAQPREVISHTVAPGVMAREVTAKASVTAVNTKESTVAVKLPDGTSRTINVYDADLKKRMANLKPGDAVVVTHTEAVAAAIRPRASKESP